MPRITPARYARRLLLLLVAVSTHFASGEAMLQYFNTSWEEITRKMPELAEAGYSSLWLPPPTKGSGGLSVGYDMWDPFDLGGKDQRGSVRTRYGTEAQLLDLVETAHRFGIRVYFDNIMNHRAFDIPGFNENTPIDIYPGMVPEDFHLRVTQEGFYRKWDNTRDWNSTWQIQNLGLADLIDIAQEPGTTNFNHGPNEGDTFPKIKFIRDLERPEQYHFDKDGNYVGFGGVLDIAEGLLNNAGNANPSETEIRERAKQYLQDNASTYEEYVGPYLNRAARWLIDRTHADGLRLDAVKHIRADFFGATFGADKDTSDYGYLGQVQRQFNLTRGFSDPNHRDTVFDATAPRDDAMVFGEHLGEPPGYGPYINAGMRLVDNPLRQQFNSRLGNPSAGLNGFDNPGAGGFAPATTVMHAQSHDNDFAARRELQHAMYFTRAGIGLLYTDGNYQAETLGESGGAFPRHANTSFLGQWDDPRVPNLLHIHNQFARGYQQGRWSDNDVVIYERIDKRENGGMTDADGVTMLFMLNDNFASGQGRNFSTSFPSTPGGADAYLYQYARGPNGSSQTGFYEYASNIVNGSTIIPPGGYFIFSWKNPDPSELWAGSGGRPITLYQNDEKVGTVDVLRRDGPNGDADFHGDTLPEATRPEIRNDASDDFAYTATLPRVTDGSDLRFVARVDGSAENVLFRLDGGIDLNGTQPEGGTDPVARDNPPALATDVFLGYEQPDLVRRIHPERFAAKDTSGGRDSIGSAGAETFSTEIGTGTFAINQGGGPQFDDGDVADFLYHDPEAPVTGDAGVSDDMFENDGSNITLWAKTNSVGAGYEMHVYYTTDGSFPEGAAGQGRGTTQVAPMSFQHNDDGGSTDWWMSANIPTPANGETLRYKIGVFKSGDGSGDPAPAWFPGGPDAVERKTKMLTQFEVDNFDATAVEYFPHFDYAQDPEGNFLTTTGLEEGFHILSARAFLERPGKASIYNTFKQSFYYDTERPTGEIRFPSGDGQTIGGSRFGVVVRTDPTVSEVWYTIDDGDPSNDDTETGSRNGNGTGFEPFSDANQNGTRDPGESYRDLNDNGQWDDDLANAWVRATQVTPNLAVTPSDPDYRKEWRFDYVNIPATGTADIQVRFRELSSAGFKDFGQSDADGHYTTLTRTVTTAGPDERVFVAFPASDGEVVGDDYVMKTYFSKSLADGLSEQELIDRFLIRIGSDEPGAVGEPQSRDAYSIEYDATENYHALAFDLPNLFNDVPDYIHRITVTHDRPSPLSDFEAVRRVKALPVSTPRVMIVNPPELDSDGKPFEITLPDVPSPSAKDREFTIRVATNRDASDVTLDFVDAKGSTLSAPDTSEEGNSQFWDFTWGNIAEGDYRFTATVTAPGGNADAARNTTVAFRELAEPDEGDADDDNDGLRDEDESTTPVLPNQSPDGGRTPAPKPNPEEWLNGEVHVFYAFGRSDPLSPDSDGDGLPDGLEVGWRTSEDPPTDPAADTDGDGFPNFIGDLDPPFYNTLDNEGSVPGVNSRSEGGDRAKQLEGSTTDPSDPDTDNDGIPDGVEDANRNGWVDGDGESLATDAAPTLGRDWPDGVMDPSETWTETDPNNRDTDGDNASDGYGEDTNFDGAIEGDTDGDRVYDAGEAWTETDPLDPDTDGDGLPDGWEENNGLDALDDGTDSLRTATAGDGNPDYGADGDPDGDGFTNAQELTNGTRPLEDDTLPPPPANSIVIGPGSAETSGTTTNNNEFTDWTIDDLLVLDEYDGDGPNRQGADVYHAFDGFDLSRDIVAFYMRDGGGDGRMYFRADFHDLGVLAEEGNLDLYVVIDTGNPAVGESALPDDVDTRTEMKWEAVVAVYETDNGAVYLDSDVGNNTTVIGEDLFANGVVRRDQNDANGFKLAYYNAELDAMEFSISRQALLDTGWNGNADTLNFQVYTTKDGTQNSPPGAGDIGGRTDIRDTIYHDFLASDYWRDQNRIAGDGSVLGSWFSRTGANDRGKRAKVALVTHGNQQIRPGSEIQDLINDGQGAGYHRLVDAHGAFGEPVNLHITGTLASAMEWAAVDPALGKPWRDGPAFNDRIGNLIADGNAALLGTTFADHVPAYTTDAFTADSVDLANTVLTSVYGEAPSGTVFWPTERIIDEGVLATAASMGFSHTVADQMRHIFKWFGRDSALASDGYRVNKVNGMRLFPINDFASGFLFENHDNGLNFPLREVLSRRARSGTQDQLLTLISAWEDFGEGGKADAYATNLRWLANRPWIEIVTLDEIAAGEVDLSRPADGAGDVWGEVDRGTGRSLALVAKDWIDHATQEDYDNWYYGSSQEEGLRDKTFEIRPGAPLPDVFGEIGVDGIADEAWDRVSQIGDGDSGPGMLARATAHAGMFLTAFHEQSNNDLSKFSTGAYINPDTDFNTMAGFAARSQASVREAALYRRVDQWAASPPGGAAAVAEDVDLDGEDEYLLYNDHVFGVFEAIGGRMVAGFARNTETGEVFQSVGTQPAFSGSADETEGAANVSGGAVAAHRTSGFKDWFADGPGGGTSQYVNALYGAAAAGTGTGWTFTSPDGHVAKTITLPADTPRFAADYSLTGDVDKLYVRMGLSPDLESLMLHGQAHLDFTAESADGRLALRNNAAEPVTAVVDYAPAATGHNAAAVDDDPGGGTEWDTVNMRNQAFTQQVELENQAGQTAFTLGLALETAATDTDADGLPNWWENDFSLDPEDDGEGDTDNGPDGNPDGDPLDNAAEYVLGGDPGSVEFGLLPRSSVADNGGGGFDVTFPVLGGRTYQLWYVDDLGGTWQKAGPPFTADADDPARTVTDDGTHTSPDPATVDRRFYRIGISR